MKSDITIKLLNNNSEITIKKGTTLYDIYTQLKKDLNMDVIGAKVNYDIVCMSTPITRNCEIEFFDRSDIVGSKIYKYGLEFVFLVAVKELFKKKYGKKCEVLFDHSLGRGVHASVACDLILGSESVKEIREVMDEIISANIPFTKMNVSKKDAYNFYESSNELEKARNVNNTLKEVLSMYELKGHLNYFYSELPYSTGLLSDYNLIYLNNNTYGLMLFKEVDDRESKKYEKITECFSNNKNWLSKIGVPCVADLNRIVSESKVIELIQICESKYNDNIFKVVNQVKERKSKFLMIAGPSSSGKTTTAKKIAISLKASGYIPIMISVDDYYLERDGDFNANGGVDYESIDALDIKLLNEHLKMLMNGEKVQIPTYKFSTGKRVYEHDAIQLKKNGIIILEGLHCVNDKLTPEIDNSLKFKLYISPLIPINIDRHNYISTSDLRLLRRMVRDNRNRGVPVTETISYWQNVRRGEEKYIFPFLNDADMVIDTSLAYEIGVLKVYAEPLLYSVSITSPYYEEAKRLILFLSNVFTIPSEFVNNDSVLREFIGASIFE